MDVGVGTNSSCIWALRSRYFSLLAIFSEEQIESSIPGIMTIEAYGFLVGNYCPNRKPKAVNPDL